MSHTPKRSRLTYANVASTLALALALSTGGAYAAGKIGSNQIQKNAVVSKHIKKQNVKTSDIKKNAIKSNRIKDNAVNGAKVADGSLSDADLALGSNGVALAGAAIDDPATILQQFNRLGGPITVAKEAVGYYAIFIPGASFSGFANLNISIQSDPYTHCFPNSAIGTRVTIRCWDFETNSQDANNLSFTLFSDASGSAPRLSAKKSATAR